LFLLLPVLLFVIPQGSAVVVALAVVALAVVALAVVAAVAVAVASKFLLSS
jgi:hypothetical protein